MGKIKVGVQLHPQRVSYATYAEAVKATEALGVDTIWNWDHFFPLYGEGEGEHFEGWTLLTAIYLHGSLLHIFFNVMWIRNLGPAAAEAFGPARMFVLFNVAGATGFFVSNAMSGAPTIGASGSIFGLLAALIVYGRKRGSSLMTRQLWQWAIILGIFGFLMPGINNWAHGGGFAGGWVAASLMGFIDERRESTALLIASLAFIAATLVGVGLSFVNVTRILLPG